MKSNYDFCIGKILTSEGGYSNNPYDRGGPTNFGITLSDYRAYINRSGTATDVKNMNVEQAKAIYKSKYWDAVNGDLLPPGIDYCVFDYGVNSGVSRALRVLNTKTAEQHAERHDIVWLINAICDERMAFLHSLKSWVHFGRGWQTRVANVRKDSIWLTTQTKSLPQPSEQSLKVSWNQWLSSLWSKRS